MLGFARRSSRSLFRFRGEARFATGPSTPFVSKHFAVEPSELAGLINKSFKDHRLNSSAETVEIKTCFQDCTRERKGLNDNAWKLNIRKDGSYYCFRCSSGGNWYNLKRRLARNSGLEITSNRSEESPAENRDQGKDPSSIGGIGQQQQQEQLRQPSATNLFAEADGVSPHANRKEDPPKPPPLPDQQSALAHHQALLAAIMSPRPTPAPSSSAAAASPLTPPASVTLSLPGAKEKNPSPYARQLVLDYLRQQRGLSDEVLMRYGVGVGIQAWPDETKNNEWTDRVTVTFPWMVKQSSPAAGNNKFIIQRVKHRAVESKGLQRILPKGGGFGFFGWHVVDDTHTEIIITEGEYDAMAACQGLRAAPGDHALKGVPVVSLPNGCNSLPPDLLPLLERFTKIYLWLDNDKAGQDAAEKFARKLGLNRCVIVKPSDNMPRPPKDANDALRLIFPPSVAGAPATSSSAASPSPSLILDMLLAAKPLPHRRLERFAHLREEVLRSIRTPLSELSGTGTPSLPTISSIIKGFRRGELTILTGPTGGGKTTLLSQMSVDFAKAGVPTLWGSFEIKNARLVEKQLQQYHTASGPLRSLSDEKLNSLADDFEALPLHYMNFHSSTQLNEIVDAMDFAVYRDDVQHIIIDNLQFMIPRQSGGGSGRGGNFDKLNAQDAVLDEFRKFATEKNVNVILVIHPRKEDEGAPLGMSSIFGTAKSTQEADVVLILQRTLGGLALAVKKNRYCGTLGRVELGYNTMSNSFFELSKSETEERARVAKERLRTSGVGSEGGGRYGPRSY